MILSWIRENRAGLQTFALAVGISAFFILVPEVSFAQFGGSGFEDKVRNINSNLITRILPLLSVLGIFYGATLAITGDGEAKGKIVTILVVSVIAFLAPMLIEWLKGIAM